ncbi:Cell division protein FtsL [bacterium HR33]|nr:Cell division protein FtsL [bacterium HR33]
MRARGRYWVAGWLIFFLAILAWVAGRQTAGVVAASELEQLRQQRATLEARQGELLARIRESRSREVLIPRAQAMGLRLPADSEIVILQVPRLDSR